MKRNPIAACIFGAVGVIALIVLWIMVGFGNAYSGWGDGATVRRTTSADEIVTPCIIYFACGVVASFSVTRWVTMKTKILICLGALLGIAATVQQVGWPLAKLTVHALDEQGQPVPGAKVRIWFREKLSDRDARKDGETNALGEFTAEGYSDMKLGSDCIKKGYYSSGSPGTIFNDSVLGKWQPWNPVETIILRPIGKPVALAAKHVQTNVPVLDQPCGYDFEKGDWVTPHGQGVQSDLTFTARRDYKSWFDFTVQADVTFAQPLGGLVRMKAPAYARNSAFSWERFAPETGYSTPHAIRFIMRDPKLNQFPERTFEINKDREQGYFFRVRTVEENGRIIAANYGKITGDIEIEARDSKTCRIIFTYYFNPTSLDRNLEWDPKRNLLQGLSREETPTAP